MSLRKSKKVVLGNTNWISRMLADKAKEEGKIVYYEDENGNRMLFDEYVKNKRINN